MQYTVSELRGLFDTLDLIEELSQKYEYFDKYQLDQRDNIFQVEFMDQHLKSQNSKMIYHYFMNHIDKLTLYEKKGIQKISDYYLKEKYAKKYFAKNLKEAKDELKVKWLECLTPKLFELSFEEDLDNLRLFYFDYYSEKFHLHSPTYQEILLQIYGQDFVCSSCRQIKKHRDKVIQFYHSYILSKKYPTNADVCELNITQQQAISFFHFFLLQVNALIKSYRISVEFSQRALIKKENHKFSIYLSPYHSFSISLFEFLKLFGEVYFNIHSKNKKYEEYSFYQKEAFCYYATLLPIISQDIAQMISKYFIEIGTTEEVFYILLKNFLALRRNPISLTNINVIQLFMVDMISYELEEKWFNGEISSSELLEKWKEMIEEYFGKTSSNKFEITLRIFQLLLEDLGIPLLKLGITLSTFERGMLTTHYHHPFKSLLEHYRSQTLEQWLPNMEFIIPHSIKEETLQYMFLYLSQLCNHVYL